MVGTARKKKMDREKTAREGEGEGEGGVGREGEMKPRTETKHHGMEFTRHENNKKRSL